MLFFNILFYSAMSLAPQSCTICFIPRRQSLIPRDLARFARRNFMMGSLSAMKTTIMLNVKVSVFMKRSEVAALVVPLL